MIGYDATSLVGLDPKTGEKLWRYVPARPRDFNVPTPMLWRDRLVLTSENNGTRLFAFDADGRLICQNIGGVSHFVADLGVIIRDGLKRYGKTGFQPGDATNKRRSSQAIYADWEASLTPALTVDAAIRAEHYSDFGSATTVTRLPNLTPRSFNAGLTWRGPKGYRENPPRPVSRLDGPEIRPPDRSARVLRGYTLLGRPVDVVETSRGCWWGERSHCTFCGLNGMGMTYRSKNSVLAWWE